VEDIKTVTDLTEVGHARRIPHPHSFCFDDIQRRFCRRIVNKSSWPFLIWIKRIALFSRVGSKIPSVRGFTVGT
jgi:hypothetical protein